MVLKMVSFDFVWKEVNSRQRQKVCFDSAQEAVAVDKKQWAVDYCLLPTIIDFIYY